MRPGSLRGAFAALLLGGLLLASCHGGTPPGKGPPIVLITFDSLRADVVGNLGGQPGLTPNLDALFRGASWSGRAIAPSSLGVSSMASLFTGLRPWQHQMLHERQSHLAKALLTLPKALKALGYATAGFSGETSYSKAFGYDQGFDQLGELEKGTAAIDRLKSLRGRQFVWIHIPEPAPPYLRRPNFEDRVDVKGLDLPPRVQPNELAPYFDPAVPLPPELRQRFWAMYRLNVAFADDRLGHFLQALRESGEWDRALLVVTSTHGEELGEKHQILNGGNLGRQLLEVPLAVKLPAGSSLRIAVPGDQRPAAARIWATLVEAAGGEVPPALSPSLFHELRGAPAAVLSELYFTNGTNQFSLLDGDDQLLRESRFAPPQPEYYRARLAEMGRGNGELARSLLSEPPEAIFGRLLASFRSTPPFTGQGAPKLTLERWRAGSGVGSVQVEDPGRKAALARILTQRWNQFLPGETTPEAEAREWYTAELH
ncbi:MAG TPA: sulfatase-like hydrolase/transferase [Thermoanaerobaculia bacterium]|nr:sulfatase-like hydrolase/transferase [Thermoanaerobaculia bacterium]